ncbi:MAG: magnesium transporter [Proteobacteria bacterium]|nr:magnesium transporter [Pseudomonadota bacterium]
METNSLLHETDLAPAALAQAMLKQHVADNAETLNNLELERASQVLAALPVERAVEVLDQPEFVAAPEIIASLPAPTAGALLNAMSADRAADIVRLLPDDTKPLVLSVLDDESRAAIQRLLVYPEDTAGSLMTTEFVSVPSTFTVGQTLEHIRNVERTRETVYAIYVLEPMSRRLVQMVSLRRLISADPAAPILSAARDNKPITVTPQTDREEVGRLFRKYDLLAVPVVDHFGHVLGIVTVDDAIDAILQEGSEDVQKFGGMEAIDKPYLQMGFGAMIKKRAGWLCALFLSEMLTASAMQSFESELEKAIVLTLFVPLIMSSGGNSGSQATSLLIQSLARQELRLRDWWRVAVRELPTGIVLGAILGLIGMARISLWQYVGFYDYGHYWPLVALTVGAALVGIVTFGSMAGSMLPFILKRLGFDPASASAPFVATLVDVTGLVIYFSVALVILRGTLL